MCFFFFFFLMIRRPPRSTPFPTRRSSDLGCLRDCQKPALPAPSCHENPRGACSARSEEHTSELQSLAYLVCRLLLEKKKYQTHLAKIKQADEINRILVSSKSETTRNICDI